MTRRANPKTRRGAVVFREDTTLLRKLLTNHMSAHTSDSVFLLLLLLIICVKRHFLICFGSFHSCDFLFFFTTMGWITCKKGGGIIFQSLLNLTSVCLCGPGETPKHLQTQTTQHHHPSAHAENREGNYKYKLYFTKLEWRSLASKLFSNECVRTEPTAIWGGFFIFLLSGKCSILLTSVKLGIKLYTDDSILFHIDIQFWCIYAQLLFFPLAYKCTCFPRHIYNTVGINRTYIW